MGKGFFDDQPETYTKDVSFAHCKTKLDIERQRIQFFNDNVIFLNCVVALLTDRDHPFLEDEDYYAFLQYINSTRPEIQDKVKTLKYIRDNRDTWFEDNSIKRRRQNVYAVGNYLKKNPLILERATECLKKNPDVNLAVREALKSQNFDMENPLNPVRKAWDKLYKQTQKVHKPQDLYLDLGSRDAEVKRS